MYLSEVSLVIQNVVYCLEIKTLLNLCERTNCNMKHHHSEQQLLSNSHFVVSSQSESESKTNKQ